jgi:hypothetical protein
MAVTPQQLDRLVSGAVPPERPDVLALEKEGFPRVPRTGVPFRDDEYPLVLSAALGLQAFKYPIWSNPQSNGLFSRDGNPPTGARDLVDALNQLLNLRRQRRIEALGFQNSCAQSQRNCERLVSWDGL